MAIHTNSTPPGSLDLLAHDGDLALQPLNHHPSLSSAESTSRTPAHSQTRLTALADRIGTESRADNPLAGLALVPTEQDVRSVAPAPLERTPHPIFNVSNSYGLLPEQVSALKKDGIELIDVSSNQITEHAFTELTSRAIAMLNTSAALSAVDGAVGLTGYCVCVYAGNPALIYSAGGSAALLKLLTNYMASTTGAAAERMFSGKLDSEIQPVSRNVMAAFTSTLAYVASTMAASENVPEKIKSTITVAAAAGLAALGMMYSFTEPDRVDMVLKARDPAYRKRNDPLWKSVFTPMFAVKVGAVATIFSSWAVNGGKGDAAQWTFVAGNVVSAALLFGGLPRVQQEIADYRIRKYEQQPKRTMSTNLYHVVDAVRMLLSLTTPTIGLTAQTTALGSIVTKNMGVAYNSLAAVGGALKGKAYRDTAKVRSRDGSAINQEPRLARHFDSAYRASLTGKVLSPVNDLVAQSVRTTGSDQSRDVMPGSWDKARPFAV